jgi:hypothetical protein
VVKEHESSVSRSPCRRHGCQRSINTDCDIAGPAGPPESCVSRTPCRRHGCQRRMKTDCDIARPGGPPAQGLCRRHASPLCVQQLKQSPAAHPTACGCCRHSLHIVAHFSWHPQPRRRPRPPIRLCTEMWAPLITKRPMQHKTNKSKHKNDASQAACAECTTRPPTHTLPQVEPALPELPRPALL